MTLKRERKRNTRNTKGLSYLKISRGMGCANNITGNHMNENANTRGKNNCKIFDKLNM